MNEQPPEPGVDYWPDQKDWTEGSTSSQPPPSLIKQAVIFILVFATLQLCWLFLRDSNLGHWVRGDLTVNPAVKLINLLTPEIQATALGNQILAKGGGLVVKLGCEGVEALFILIAALVTAPLSRKAIISGIFYGTVFVYSFNQLRIISLFYAFRVDKPLFHLLHGTIAPLLLIALAGIFFQFWLLKYSAKTTTHNFT